MQPIYSSTRPPTPPLHCPRLDSGLTDTSTPSYRTAFAFIEFRYERDAEDAYYDMSVYFPSDGRLLT